MKLSTVTKIITWILMGVSVLLGVLYFTGIVTEEPFIVWAYILFAIALVLAVVFPIMNLVLNPKNALKALMGLAIVGVIFIIAYLLADTTPIKTLSDNPDFSNPGVLALSDTGIYTLYITFTASLLLLVFTGIRGIIKK